MQLRMVAGLIAASVGVSAAAGGTAAASPSVSLVSPANTADLRVDEPTLVVRVRTSGAGFRARVGARDVTRRFGRSVDGVRTARLVRGRDFRVGRGSFVAAVGRASTPSLRTAGFGFTAWREDRRPQVTLRRRAGRSPLSIDVRPDAAVVGTRVWVNGREARDHRSGSASAGPSSGARCACSLELGPHHGVRFGANRVTVELQRAGNRFQRATRSFRVARSAPLVSAGPDRDASPKRPAVLDASRSRPAHAGGRLVYRWRIVAEPRGARARLVGAGRARPRLIAKQAGVYRVRLRAAELPPAGARRSATRSAAAQAPADATAAQDPAAARTAQTPSTPLTPERPSTPLTPSRPPTPSTPLRPADPLVPLMPGTPLERLQTVGPIVSDEVEVGVDPTDDPMGVPIQTIASDGAIKLGTASYGLNAGKWLNVLVLEPLHTRAIGAGSFTAGELPQAKSWIEHFPRSSLVVLSVPTAQNWTYPTSWWDKRKANFDTRTFHALVAELGGIADTSDGWSTMGTSQWSLIGTREMVAGQAQQNVGASQAAVPGFRGGDAGRAGTLNGYLQRVSSNAYSYVSPEFLTIDTAAPGSDSYTRNVIAIGGTSYPSAQIANGSTGAQLLVLDGSNGMKPVVQQTYTIIQGGGTALDGTAGNPAKGDWGSGVKGLANALQYVNRISPDWNLVVLQTFGQGQWWGNSPNPSPSWVNDDVGSPNLGSWDGQQFATSDGSDNSANKLYGVWNPVGPTVAGQIGSITSPAGHDVVAGFGAGQDNQGTPNGGLTVVANTHPYDGRRNRVQGQTGQVQSDPRLVGTLTRTRQGQWTVQTATSQPAFAPSTLWQTAFGPRRAWPFSSGAGYQAAMGYIADQLYGAAAQIDDVRTQYVAKTSADWNGLAATTQGLPYPAGSDDFTSRQFTDLRGQLVAEMRYVAAIDHLVKQWQRIFADSTFSGYVNLQNIANVVAENSKANASKHANQTTGLDWLDVSDYSLEVAAGIVGFTPAAELAEPMGLVANLLGLASAATPAEGGDGGETRGASQQVWDKAHLLGGDLVARYESMSTTIDHIEDLLLGDWGKLQVAGQNANGSWAFGSDVRIALKQSLAASAAREFYEALLPLTYTQWVISPNATGALDDPRWGPSARSLPGRAYRCWSDDDDPTNAPGSHPFSQNPDGSLHYGVVHGWSPPGSVTAPAAANQSFYMLRVLKSHDDPMEVVKDVHRGNDPTIWHRGTNPPASLVDPLFQPLNPADTSGQPTQLGIDKTEFYSDYGDGWGWRRAVCS